MSPPALPAALASHDLIHRWIWTLYRAHPHLTQRQLVRLTGLSQPHVSRTLAAMQGAGLLAADEAGRLCAAPLMAAQEAASPPPVPLADLMLPLAVSRLGLLSRWLWSLCRTFPGARQSELSAATGSRVSQQVRGMLEAGYLKLSAPGRYAATLPKGPGGARSANFQKDAARAARRVFPTLKRAAERAAELFAESGEKAHVYHVMGRPGAGRSHSVYVAAPDAAAVPALVREQAAQPAAFPFGSSEPPSVIQVREMNVRGELLPHLTFPTYRLARMEAGRRFTDSGVRYAITMQEDPPHHFQLCPLGGDCSGLPLAYADERGRQVNLLGGLTPMELLEEVRQGARSRPPLP